MAIEHVPERFPALLLRRFGDSVSAAIEDVSIADLPDAPVLVKVEYSGINYKDALAVTNMGKIVRRFPMVPGVDLAGTVVECADGSLRPGDAVLATGCGIGEEHWGGLASYARLQPEWVIPMPMGFTARHAMSLGTAGFTAMLCVEALEAHGVQPGDGDVLVTGATGGVGAISVMLLAKLGYRVSAVTGKPEAAETLRALGAADVLPREQQSAPPKALETARWAGVVDTVGGSTLVRALAETRLYGCVAACGNAGGARLEATVFPFILRGVTLAGISSVNQPRERRIPVWERMAKLLPAGAMDGMVNEITLPEVEATAGLVLRGGHRGRNIVRLT
jgi:acrylyl-CoA reductase (NADPH)